MTTAPKTAVPPADANGELDAANTILKRFKKQLADLTPDWRQWVLDSAQAAYPNPDNKTALPKD